MNHQMNGSDGLNRRMFLAGTAGALAGLAAVPELGSAAEPGAQADEPRKKKVTSTPAR